MSDDIYCCPVCGAEVHRAENVIPLRCLLCGASLRDGLAVQVALPFEED